MRKGHWFRCLAATATFVVAFGLPVVSSLAQPLGSRASANKRSLRVFLRSYLGNPYPLFEKQGPTRYSAAFVDLGDNGRKEVIVYVTGRGWCGSGGCLMLILAPHDSSYKIVTSATIVWPPIRVLATKSHGWHDISVDVHGGGIRLGYQALLQFNGKTYPNNPTVSPALPLRVKAPGKTVITWGTKGKRLYQ